MPTKTFKRSDGRKVDEIRPMEAKVGIVLDGKMVNIDMMYLPIIEKIRKYGINYPEYLNPEEIEQANYSVAFSDKLAQKIERYLRSERNETRYLRRERNERRYLRRENDN